MRDADLIVGHAGSGTITEALRLGKPMVVVGKNRTCALFFEIFILTAICDEKSTSR